MTVYYHFMPVRTEYCGKVEHHDYQLYLAINDIDHTRTKVMSPKTNGICERFHKTILQGVITTYRRIFLLCQN